MGFGYSMVERMLTCFSMKLKQCHPSNKKYFGYTVHDFQMQKYYLHGFHQVLGAYQLQMHH